LELRQNGTALGHIIFDSATAEDHIHNVAKYGEMLTEPVPPELEIGTYLSGVPNPAWRIPGWRHPEGRILSLRHPGHGWHHFAIPDHEA
jgi:hypothetical protein